MGTGFQQVVTQGSKVRAGVRGDDIVVTTRELARLLDKQALAAHPTPSPELVAFVARYKDGLYRHEVQGARARACNRTAPGNPRCLILLRLLTCKVGKSFFGCRQKEVALG